MSKQITTYPTYTLLLALAISSTAPKVLAQEDTSRLFTPPGMPALTTPGSIQVLPSAKMADAISPFTADRRAEMVAARQAAKKRGWNEVTEAQAMRVDSYFDRPELRNRMRPLQEMINELRVAPSVLGGTILGRAESIGASGSGAFANGGWTGLIRAFTEPKLGRVVLEEFDYVAAGTQITVPQEMIDGDVNGMPMLVDAYRAPSGNGYTEFTWFTRNKQFILRVGRYVPETSELRAEVQMLMSQLL